MWWGYVAIIWNITTVRAVTGALKSASKGSNRFGRSEVAFNAADVLSSNPGVGCVLRGKGRNLSALLSRMRHNRERAVYRERIFAKTRGRFPCIAPQAQKEDPPSPYMPGLL